MGGAGLVSKRWRWRCRPKHVIGTARGDGEEWGGHSIDDSCPHTWCQISITVSLQLPRLPTLFFITIFSILFNFHHLYFNIFYYYYYFSVLHYFPVSLFIFIAPAPFDMVIEIHKLFSL